MYLRDRVTNDFHYSQFVDELLGNNYSLLPGNDNTTISLGHGVIGMEWRSWRSKLKFNFAGCRTHDRYGDSSTAESGGQ